MVKDCTLSLRTYMTMISSMMIIRRIKIMIRAPKLNRTRTRPSMSININQRSADTYQRRPCQQYQGSQYSFSNVFQIDLFKFTFMSNFDGEVWKFVERNIIQIWKLWRIIQFCEITHLKTGSLKGAGLLDLVNYMNVESW